MTVQEIRELQNELRACEHQLLVADTHHDMPHYKKMLRLRDQIARRLENEFKD